MNEAAARARIAQWKQSLVKRSAAQPLIAGGDAPDGPDADLKSIPLAVVDPVRLAGALAEGAAFALVSGAGRGGAASAHAAGDPAEGVLCSPLASSELRRRLVAIRRAARDALAAGSHTLWLGFGRLIWSGAAAEGEGAPVPREAPIALWPVMLVRGAAGALRLTAAAGVEPRCNRALVRALREQLGDAEVLPLDRGAVGVAALVAWADAVAAARAGWRVERTVQLGLYALAPLALLGDLEAWGDELLASPVVALLANGAAGAADGASDAASRSLTAGAAGLARLDAAPRGHDVVAPIDADASQLAAVAAAGAVSFVLDGAPGTGKSQVIANAIAHCAAHGQTVLFVADRAASLDTVHRRLTAIGLGDHCVALSGERAVRAAVVAQLGRVLERAFRPAAGQTAEAARLAAIAAALDGHVAALHRVGPFGRSLHEVIGRLVELRAAPCAALAEPDATGLDRHAFEQRSRAVERLAEAAAAVEPVAHHPWRQSTLEHWQPDAQDRAAAAIDEASAAGAALAAAVQGVARLIPGIVARTEQQLEALGALAALAAASPRPGAELLNQLRGPRGDDVVERIALIRARGAGAIEPPREPGEFLVLASRHRQLAIEVNDRFTDSVGELDAHALWLQLRRWTNRVAPLRFMALRQARAAIRGAAMPGMLETDAAMITALESVIAERAARAALVAAGEPARRWFGELGGDPLALDLARIEAAVEWAARLRRAFDAVDVARGDAGRAAAWRAVMAQVAASPPAESPGGGELAAFARVAEAVGRWRTALVALADATGIATATLAAGDDHLAALAERSCALGRAQGRFRDWVAFHAARQAARAAGVGPAVGAIERGELAAAELAAAWRRATLLAWAEAELADTPALAGFDGAAHHARAAAFAELDRAALAGARRSVQACLAERVPRGRAEAGGEQAALVDELRTLRALHEAPVGDAGRAADPEAAPTPPRPGALRRLFAELANLAPRLAPCFMMSPEAVAEHLDPALPRFDVVVIDAHELATSDAIGALARGRTAVIVGDASGATGAAGLLRDCVAAGLPVHQLSTHHRSHHERLFAFVEQRYCGDRIAMMPAAVSSPELGVVWQRVDGRCDATGENCVEAETVVADVVRRLSDPAQRARSIAVVTLSYAQQTLIEELLEAARASDPALDELFGPSHPRGEPVIVRRLDAIAGDERDVVMLSVGYGRDGSGAAHDFGPLSRAGGEHQLGVAITRAREQLIVVSSIGEEDVNGASEAGEDADRPMADGVRCLAAVLAFAARQPPSAGDVVPVDPIAAAIARALVERGWTVRHRVGYGPYRIDLAIVDPGAPQRYVLAIELDGAAYAGAAAARDRDRLRTQMLVERGWRVHRIWALDWWRDPERELARAHGAIVTALAASRQRRASGTARFAAARAVRPADIAAVSPVEVAPDATGPDAVSGAPRDGEATGDAAAADSAGSDTTHRTAVGPVATNRNAARTRRAKTTSAVPRASKGAAADPPTAATTAASRSDAATADTGAMANQDSAGTARAAGGKSRAASSDPAAAARAGNTTAASRAGNAAAAPPTAKGQAAQTLPAALAAGSGPTDAVASMIAEISAPIAGGSAPIRIARNTIAIGPYLAAAIPAGRRAPDDLFAARHVGELGKIVDQVLAAEAPMHVDVLARRVGAYFGIGRPTPRVVEQVRAALDGRGQWGDEADVVWRLDQDPAGVPAVRVAGQGASARRAIEEVPLCEVAAAARIVVERAAGIAAADLVRDAARLLGFARLTDNVVARVAQGVRLAAQRTLIQIDRGSAALPD